MESTSAQTYSGPEEIPKIDDINHLPPLVAMAKVPGYLGDISRSKVYELVATGELTRVRIGARAFISGESITAFLTKVLTSGGAA